MTIKSGSGQACAACKYQRRRCTPECLLAPFFPADQPKTFQNVHRLFGVKNIQNLLKELSPHNSHLKAEAMRNMKAHATLRDKHPVLGCQGEIRQLQYQIQLAHEELQVVLHHLAYYRQQHQHQHHQVEDHKLSPTTDEYISDLHLGMAPPRNAGLAFQHEDANSYYNTFSASALPLSYSNSSNNVIADFNINYLDFKDINNVVNSTCQRTYSNSNDNDPNSSIVTHSHLIMQQHHHHPPFSNDSPQDYNEMRPFFDTIDDTQSYIDSKEAYDQSSCLESSLKDSRQLVEEMDENELKSAAACFSLTSVN